MKLMVGRRERDTKPQVQFDTVEHCLRRIMKISSTSSFFYHFDSPPLRLETPYAFPPYQSLKPDRRIAPQDAYEEVLMPGRLHALADGLRFCTSFFTQLDFFLKPDRNLPSARPVESTFHALIRKENSQMVNGLSAG